MSKATIIIKKKKKRTSDCESNVFLGAGKVKRDFPFPSLFLSLPHLPPTFPTHLDQHLAPWATTSRTRATTSSFLESSSPSGSSSVPSLCAWARRHRLRPPPDLKPRRPRTIALRQRLHHQELPEAVDGKSWIKLRSNSPTPIPSSLHTAGENLEQNRDLRCKSKVSD